MIVVIKDSYEWLVTYLVYETDRKQKDLQKDGLCKVTARNSSQVYRAAVLAKVYSELQAVTHYWRRIHREDVDERSRTILEKLGILYGLTCLDKHLIYFYQGGYNREPILVNLVKEGVLLLCNTIKPDVIGVIDALAPPDFALNSVLGKADGQVIVN